MAEAMLRTKAQKYGRKDIECASAGTYVWPGDLAAKATVRELKSRGIDIDGRPARQLDEKIGTDADVILTMTQRVSLAVKAILPDQAEKVHTLCDYVGETGDIDDPYGCGEEVYHATADQIDRLLEKLLARLEN
jgi:protein-tyrosine-phosphatase